MDQELYHFGVRGMKWGIRKTKPNSTLKRVNSKTGNTIKKNISDLSDEELNTKLKRMRLEREYVQITRDLAAPRMNLARRAVNRVSNDLLTAASGAVVAGTIALATPHIKKIGGLVINMIKNR